MISGKAYSAEALKNATAPFAFYSLHADSDSYALDGPTGLLTGVFSIHCVAISYPQLVALSGAVRAAFQVLQGTAINGLFIEQVIVEQASPDLKEKDVYLYRRVYDLQIKYQEV